jgi:hypothetical protein
LKGDHVFALPYASCLSTFRAPDGGHPQSFHLVVGGTQLCGSWYLSAIVRLQGFSSVSPAASPRRWSPKTVTTSPWVGRSKSGCDLGPTLSFKDVHHPRWGGGRDEPELYLPRGFVGQPLLQRSRERALTGPARGADFDNAGLVDGGRRQLQRVGLVGLAPDAPSCRKGGCRAVRTGGPPKTSRAARAVLRLHRYGAPAWRSVLRSSGRIRVGIWRRADGSCRWCRGGGGSRSPCRRRDYRHHPRFGPPALCTCPRPSSISVGEGKVAAASALRPSLPQFGHPERGSLLLLPEWASASHQSVFCCSTAPPIKWGCSYLRRWNWSSVCNGTLNAGLLFIVAVGA